MKARFLTLLTTLTFLAFSGLAVANPCQPGDDPKDHKHCGDGGDGGNANGMGSDISMECLLGNETSDTIKPDEHGSYYDAVEKVDCSIRGPSIPWPIRLGVGGGKGKWANVRQVDINLGAFVKGNYKNPDGTPFTPDNALLQGTYANLFNTDMDPLRLNVRPYRKDPDQTEGSIHLLTPGESYEMGMRFTVPVNTGSEGSERFTVSIASQWYDGNEGFTGIACESGDELAILANSPDGDMRDVSVYLWDDDDDDFPDGYTVTTGSFMRDTSDDSIVVDEDGFPMVKSGSRWAAVCSAAGKDCGNPNPSNCNFLGYVAIQFTLDTMVN